MKKIITVICLVAACCAAQTINIKGIVRNTSQEAIAGATVRLEIAGLSTTTGPDGSFTLNGTMNTKQPFIYKRLNASTPAWINNGRIIITLSANMPVGISSYNLQGRLIYGNKRTFSSGWHEIPLPLTLEGIYLCKVALGDEVYTFKSSPFGTFQNKHRDLPDDWCNLSDLATVQPKFSDVISITKKGQINYRDSILKNDTIGVEVIMHTNAGDVTDTDGNVYQSIKIGNQVWTVGNLKTTKYNDGTPIRQVTDSVQWVNDTIGAYCSYNNDSSNKDRYGLIYNGYAVKTGKLAPNGWHVPTPAEWDTLADFLARNGYTWDGKAEGKMIAKSMASTTDWQKKSDYAGTIGNNPGGNNKSGFTALPGGLRDRLAKFQNIGLGAYFHTGTPLPDSSQQPTDDEKIRVLQMSYTASLMNLTEWLTIYGASMRVVLDNIGQ
jgi:uncharacterized protein (TIGR02145 family)